MSSLRTCAVAAALMAVAPGCGSDESAPTVPPLGAAEAPVLAEAALGSLAVQGALIGNRIGDGPIIDLPHLVPIAPPVYRLLRDFDITPPTRDKGCVTQSGEWVDADKDGIPVGYTVTFDCHDVLGAVFNYSLVGAVAVNDTNDNDPKSGYEVAWLGFDLERTFIKGGIQKALYVGGTQKLGRDAHVISLGEDYTVSARISQGETTHTGTLQNKQLVVYHPDDGADPMAAGYVLWLAQNTFTYDGVVHRLRTQTDPTLHFQEACRVAHPGYAGWDGGAVVYSDGSSLRIEYSGCNEMKATLDGEALPL